MSISGPDAGKAELSNYLEKFLATGAFGFKLLSGHHALSPETTAAAIEVVNQADAYTAFHRGTP